MSKSNKTVDDYVLEELKKKPATTHDLRKKGVFSPAGSIRRLREQGHNIETKKKSIVDDFGIKRHRVAEYHLKGRKQPKALLFGEKTPLFSKKAPLFSNKKAKRGMEAV